MPTQDDAVFEDAIQGLHRGDFSRLEPLFDEQSGPSGKARIVEWHEEGRFESAAVALAEALTCAAFLGRINVVTYLLRQGLDPSGGSGTGLNAIQWAANRGQLNAVRVLIGANAPLETRSMYDGTALGTAVWAAVHETRPDHPQIIEALLIAGARPDEAEYPSGREDIDAILRRYRPA
jgi:hypothetical protein